MAYRVCLVFHLNKFYIFLLLLWHLQKVVVFSVDAAAFCDAAVGKLSSYGDLDEIFEKEKQLVDQRVGKLEEFSREHGFDGNDLSEDIENCLNLILEIEEIQKASGNLRHPTDSEYNRCLERIAEKKS